MLLLVAGITCRITTSSTPYVLTASRSGGVSTSNLVNQT